MLNGPFVLLTNQMAGSDGDIFPQANQLEGLAPVIGKRSLGGVVGITGVRPLQDGGLVTQPVIAWWDQQKGWGVENHGVDPDIEVENLPQDLARDIAISLAHGVRIRIFVPLRTIFPIYEETDRNSGRLTAPTRRSPA